MRLRRRAVDGLNRLLRGVGVQVVRSQSEKPWDREFARWIAEAKHSGRDPNDVGDRDWRGTALENASRNLFPRITKDSVVLELGPGSGRYTRHVLPRCREMIVIDYSALVCDWLREYLSGRGRFRVYLVDRPAFADVTSEEVDFAFANGVFEHIELDEVDFFLREFFRTLKPGGRLWFNFDNFMSAGGLRWFEEESVHPGGRRLFRFYHPEMLKKLVESRGFTRVAVTVDEGRLASLEAVKPAVPGTPETPAG